MLESFKKNETKPHLKRQWRLSKIDAKFVADEWGSPIEFSALSKQCLGRRIGDIQTIVKEVESWTEKRNEMKDKVKIQWQFTKDKARTKFEKRYEYIAN